MRDGTLVKKEIIMGASTISALWAASGRGTARLALGKTCPKLTSNRAGRSIKETISKRPDLRAIRDDHTERDRSDAGHQRCLHLKSATRRHAAGQTRTDRLSRWPSAWVWPRRRKPAQQKRQTQYPSQHTLPQADLRPGLPENHRNSYLPHLLCPAPQR